jgi:aconitate hydratase
MSRVRRGAGAELTARIATAQPDDISTGDLAPDGAEVMAYRSNVPAIAEFTLRQLDRDRAAVPRRARCLRQVVRAHPPAQPDQGILALTFVDDADFERAEVGQCWCLPHIRDELAEGSDRITVCIEDNGDEFALTHDFADKEREILLRGGLLEYLRAGAA